MPVFDESTLFLAKPEPGDWSLKCKGCRYKVPSCGQLFAESKALKHAIKWHHDVNVTDKDGNTQTYRYATIETSGTPPF